VWLSKQAWQELPETLLVRELRVTIENPGFRAQTILVATTLLNTIARDTVPLRPNRAEPRARKRRPKNYHLLTKPRHLFKETPHRSKYAKP